MEKSTPKTAIIKKDEKQQDQKKQIIFQSRYRPGLKLFALNTDNLEIYEIKINDSKTLSIVSGKKTSSKHVSINPDHPMMWSLNRKNVIKKFNRKFKLNLK